VRPRRPAKPPEAQIGTRVVSSIGSAPSIIRAVPDDDRARAKLAGDHLALIPNMLHRHAAEDELLWPVILRRAGLHAEIVHRMEVQHSRLEDLLHRLGELNNRWRSRNRGR
jgi:hypothetical protein